MAPARRSLDLPVAQNESISVDLDPLPPPDDLQVFIEALVDERPEAKYWTRLATQCWIENRAEEAQLICQRGIQVLARSRPHHALPLYNLLAAFALERTTTAPKQILQDAKYQNLANLEPKHAFARDIIPNLNQAQPIDPTHHINQLTKAIHATNTADNQTAQRIYDSILKKHPRHAIALMGKACILLRNRQYAPALKLYQQGLEVILLIKASADKDPQNPNPPAWKGPDPRVGIGLCLWGLGNHNAARKAWQRATQVNPTNAAAHLLLAISSLNVARQPVGLVPGTFGAFVERTENEARALAYTEGMASLQESWKLEKRNAMTAVAMAEHFIQKATESIRTNDPAADSEAMRSYSTALKLGEHAIQYADSRAAVVQAWLCYARANHLASQLPANSANPELRLQAQRYYSRVIEDLSRSNSGSAPGTGLSAGQQLPQALTIAVLGLAQCQVANRDALAAMNTLESLTSKPASASSASQMLEPSLLAASLRAKSHPGASPSERLADAERARVMLDRVLRFVQAARTEVHGTEGEESDEMPEEGANGTSQLNGSVVNALNVLRSEELSQAMLESIASLADDPLAHVEFANLLQTEELVRATAAYADALRLAQRQAEDADSNASPSLVASLQNNLGAILALRAFEIPESEAQRQEERSWLLNRGISRLGSAIEGAASSTSTDGETQRIIEAVKVMASYNLGRANEVAGNADQAKQAYEALLRVHPEYVDAKVRLALLTVAKAPVPSSAGAEAAAAEIRRVRDTANALFKEALAADPSNLDTRASYVCFLAGELPGNPTPAWGAIKDFTAQLFAGPEAGKNVFGSAAAAKAAADEGRRDAHTLASLGWAYYQLAIHAAPGPNAKADRAKGMLRAADLMDKSLGSDPRCAFAAQSMAILYAEDALGEIDALSEERRRANADEALAILSKLREVREEGSVHVCMGHVLMLKDEFERALKAYELASRRYYADANPAVLGYMARAQYAMGMKAKSPVHLRGAISNLERALSLLREEGPEWRQAAYNHAVMAHRALQMLLDLPAERRSKDELRDALATVQEIQPRLSGSLSTAAQLGYITPEVVEQRARYAESTLLVQGPAVLAEQEAWEQEREQQRQAVIAARKEKELALEREKLAREEQYRIEAEAMAEKRRLAREEAARIEYVREVSQEREVRRRTKKSGADANDEDSASEQSSEDGDAEIVRNGLEMQQQDEQKRQRKKEKKRSSKKEARRKKRVRDDEDDDGPVATGKKKRPAVNDMIDSDEENMFLS